MPDAHGPDDSAAIDYDGSVITDPQVLARLHEAERFLSPELRASVVAGDPGAIGPLLDVYFAHPWELVPHDVIIRALAGFGPPALEPLLAAIGRARDTDDLGALCEALAKLGVRDERLFETFRGLFEVDVVFGALVFARYGDVRALPLIEAQLSDASFTEREYLELAVAYRDLGGVPTPTMLARLSKAMDRPKPAPQAKVGRNDPCPCGSGKKHKKCCAA